MEERGNKTLVCSVFFMDIVEYSKKSVAEQISLKERFNQLLSIAIRNVPLNDRIILDTGDGAAVTFLGDIEDALQAALSMRASLLSESAVVDNNNLLVRMGINLGPARLVKDINGQINIVGDGINVAQRVMGFAESGQILVSRSYFDAVSRISEEFAGLFHYQGSKTDKHVREHEIYAIGYPGDIQVNRATIDRRLAYAKFSKFFARQRERVLNAWRSGLIILKNFYQQKLTAFLQLPAKNRIVWVILTIAPMVLVLMFIATMSLKADKPLVVVPVAEVPASVPKVETNTTKSDIAKNESKTVTSPVKKTPSEPIVKSETEHKKIVPTPPKPSIKAEPVLGKTKNTIPSAKQKVMDEPILVTTKTVGQTNQADGMGEVILAVKPWGEVYLDGKKQGISPPLMTLKMSVGHHEILIRNGDLPQYKTSVQVLDAKKLTVSHVFN